MALPGKWRHALAAGALAALCLAGPVSAEAGTIRKVGAVTWHPARYAGQDVVLVGYLLLRENGYVFFSDEPTGKLSAHDLPVTGSGLDAIRPDRRYILHGTFVYGGLTALNGYDYHLNLTADPVAAKN